MAMCLPRILLALVAASGASVAFAASAAAAPPPPEASKSGGLPGIVLEFFAGDDDDDGAGSGSGSGSGFAPPDPPARVRVQALSATLIRVEAEGPRGFEDRPTFAAPGRPSFEPGGDGDGDGDDADGGGYTGGAGGGPVVVGLLNRTSEEAWVGIDANFAVLVRPRASWAWRRARGANVDDEDATPFEEVTVSTLDGRKLWSLKDAVAARNSNDDDDGGDDASSPLNVLNWPAPLTAEAYAFEDAPRFVFPKWGPTPVPSDADVDPALKGTNGYDFRNDADGDLYVHLFPYRSAGACGDAIVDEYDSTSSRAASAKPCASAALEAWHRARSEFLRLTGPVPLLPDYAFGTWFTYWHSYTEAEAKAEIERWEKDDLPLDVWALDMNWRNSPTKHQDGYQEGWNHYYNHPNTELFPSFSNSSGGTGWFDYLKSKGLRTYFNDHPFPADNGTAYQTTPDEVNFRWDGLTFWMDRGLTFWWFDANWRFSIPPPNVPYGGTGDGPSWRGLDNRVWGSHLYYTTSRVYNEKHPSRNHTLPAQRPLSLTKYAADNMHPGLVQHEHVAHHRYPVWWTGDGVDLQASVQSMVDAGVYDLKPYVHSDCGGDYRGNVGGDLIRWTAHCALGSVLRFHGGEHQPWSYDKHTEDVIRSYVKMRYRLLPSLIAAGRAATSGSGFPLVARCDLFWPGLPGASSNEQYVFLNDTLVAPIWDSSTNVTTREVWIPPGSWRDAWSGGGVTGPKNLTASQPYERIPLWHRVGGLVVTTAGEGDDDANRVDDQDWSELTLEAFPDTAAEPLTIGDTPDAAQSAFVERWVHARDNSGDALRVTMSTTHSSDSEGSGGDGTAIVKFTMDSWRNEAAAPQAWVVRVHLPRGRVVDEAVVDGVNVPGARLRTALLLPHSGDGGGDDGSALSPPFFVPFGGKGARPAPLAGPVLELTLEPSVSFREVSVTVSKERGIDADLDDFALA